MSGAETRTVTYLAPGTVPDLTPAEPLLDPKLAEIRDAEIKANDVTIEPAPEPTIAPELVKARDEEIKRLGGKPLEGETNVAPEADKPAKTAAKKASPRRSS